jgi:hypothetical protein
VKAFFSAIMETAMYTALAGTFFLLSIAILMAHAMEGFALGRVAAKPVRAIARTRAERKPNRT